jgi:hypothetical protein
VFKVRTTFDEITNFKVFILDRDTFSIKFVVMILEKSGISANSLA